MNELQQAIEALGLNWEQVQNVCVVLMAIRFLLKGFSGKLQAFLEKLIASAYDTGDSRIIKVVVAGIQSWQYRTIALLVDAVTSFKLPIKVPSKEKMPDSAS